jgi:hypothetical protein
MNPCIICLEETNKLFKNENCKCKYNVHPMCLNKWSNHSGRCMICKTPIINKPSLVLQWTTEWILAPLAQILFVPLLVVYICFMNSVYLLNVYVYDQLER